MDANWRGGIGCVGETGGELRRLQLQPRSNECEVAIVEGHFARCASHGKERIDLTVVRLWMQNLDRHNFEKSKLVNERILCEASRVL